MAIHGNDEPGRKQFCVPHSVGLEWQAERRFQAQGGEKAEGPVLQLDGFGMFQRALGVMVAGQSPISHTL